MNAFSTKLRLCFLVRAPPTCPHHDDILKASENKVLGQLTADPARPHHEHAGLPNDPRQFAAQTSVHDAQKRGGREKEKKR